MDLNGLSGLNGFNEYITNANSASAEALKSRLNGKVTEKADEDELLNACKEFEAYLWEQVFKEMQKTAKIFNDDEDKDSYAGNMVDYFKDTVIKEISAQTADTQGANSLAQMLYTQMKRNYHIE